MTLSLTKEIIVHSCFIKNGLSVVRVVSTIHKATIRSIYDREFIFSNKSVMLRLSDVCHKQYQNLSLRQLSTSSQFERICWKGSSHAVLLRNLDNALNNHQVGEAWEVFHDFKRLYGIPEPTLVSRLISELSYSSNSYWLQKACNLVFSLLKERSNLVQLDLLTKLSLSLARAQMPVPASMMLRLMLEKENVPPNKCLVIDCSAYGEDTDWDTSCIQFLG